MNDRRLEALEPFDDVSVPPEDAAVTAARRKRVIERTASVIRTEAAAREGRGRRARIFSIVAAAAGVMLVGSGGVAWRASHPSSTDVAPAQSVARLASATGAVVVTRDGRGTAAAAEKTDLALEPADEVTTAPGARARMVLASGATVEIVEGSRVRVVPSVPKNERVGLAVGEIAVHVPKLAANEAFRVETPNSIVTVHGTTFRVSVRDGASHVIVTEGVVSVTHDGREDVLRAGDQWPSAIAPAPASAAPAPPSVAGPDVQSPTAKAPPRTHAPKIDPSTLAEQNALLQGALDARRRGNDGQALEELGRFLTRYPNSPLAQEARVEKFRALERMGRHAKAVADARRYLADYPNGFAVEEARALVLR